MAAWDRVESQCLGIICIWYGMEKASRAVLCPVTCTTRTKARVDSCVAVYGTKVAESGELLDNVPCQKSAMDEALT